MLAYMGCRLWNEVDDWITVVIAVLLSYVFIEPASGVLHVVLDNEKFNSWPLLGEVAESFQRHHEDPNEIATRPGYRFALEPTVPCAVIATQALYIKSTLSMATIFFLWPASLLMMFAHRWAHMSNSKKPYLCKILQKAGIIMTDPHHHKHHSTYDTNFCICAGWANPTLNWFVKGGYFWDEEDMRWFGVLAFAYFLPTVVAVATGDIGHVSVDFGKTFGEMREFAGF